jgi:hypothetical protein
MRLRHRMDLARGSAGSRSFWKVPGEEEEEEKIWGKFRSANTW